MSKTLHLLALLTRFAARPGLTKALELMVVVWTPRDDDVRIVSVRKPTSKERRNYEEGV